MIFFEEENKKKKILFGLVTVAMFFIIFQYTKINIFNNISSNQEAEQYWNDLGQVVSKTGQDIEKNFDVAEENLDNFKYEQERERKQAILLEATKDFLEKNKNTSTSNATSTE